MSFSNKIKKELSKKRIVSKLEALLELSSILKVNASISIRNAFININFFTESEYVVKRIYKLIDYLYEYECVISRLENNNIMKDGLYSLTVEDEYIVEKMMSESGFDIFGGYRASTNKVYSRIISLKENGASAFLRGIFMGAGTVVDPQKSYNLELVLNNKEDYEIIKSVLNYLKIDFLYKERRDKKIIYFKNSEIIAEFLHIIGATNSMLSLENVKVKKDISNNINRKMNFEMANMSRTIESSMEQIKAIEILEVNNKLPEEYIELAQYRKEYPEFSLKQIGEKFNPPISKSTLAYKMNKIKKLANEIK